MMLDGAEKRHEMDWERTAWLAARMLSPWSKRPIDHYDLLGKKRPRREVATNDQAAFDILISDDARPIRSGQQSTEERAAELEKMRRQVESLAERGLLED
jgi:hypothetical protein